MILKDAFAEGIRKLKLSNIDAPVVTAGAILCYILGRERTFLYSHDEYLLSNDEYENYCECLKRVAEGEPLQYITGVQEFMSLNFNVCRKVLIPRQDTEILVESVLEYAGQKENASILDIGTGSGCVAISLAYYGKNTQVMGVDISKGALEVARINARNCGVEENTVFVQSNLFDNVPPKKFDIIVSNPPYIPIEVIETLDKQVKDFEPKIALDGGADGLDFYRRITQQSVSFLESKGLLAFEVGFDQAQKVVEIMEVNFENIKVKKDLAGIERVVTGNLSK
ncbi:MAG: peptide chain release factor N(5)-glutamine methyltransferase [Clostridiaceae bacterium]|nr:peptide chain release factor N(5)-glutamine methyltransferase [Clostridiaceae bacterium]